MFAVFGTMGGMRMGYARVSRKDQKLEPQRVAQLADGCERVFEEKISNREAERNAFLREAFRPEPTT
jgi:DNA invertase Pin-like site-specific DNA recombinase